MNYSFKLDKFSQRRNVSIEKHLVLMSQFYYDAVTKLNTSLYPVYGKYCIHFVITKLHK